MNEEGARWYMIFHWDTANAIGAWATREEAEAALLTIPEQYRGDYFIDPDEEEEPT